MTRPRRVLKVTPRAMYTFFNKDFTNEITQHAEVAEGADHIVAVEDTFDADVTFGDVILPCHIAELHYVEGAPLARYLSGKLPLSAAEASQIACDLFRMKEEFERCRVNHNDLHAGNIIVQRLPLTRRRPDVIDPEIRAVAIDLGSVAPDRRSGGHYLGDLHWIGRHIHAMADRLLADGDAAGDLENRMALKLHGIAQCIAPATENQRPPSASDFIQQIRDEYHRTAETWRPWQQPLVPNTFEAPTTPRFLWMVRLRNCLSTQDGSWLAKISAPGPLVMTGMRGCGKTMLLKSLQFHARAAGPANQTTAEALDRLRRDGFVGSFVSGANFDRRRPENGIQDFR